MFKGRNHEFIQRLTAMRQVAEKTQRFAGLPEACVRATIKDVDDPENRGRVRVLFDDFNRDIPQSVNAGQGSDQRIADDDPQLSHWINTIPAFKGKQPKSLVGKRVGVMITTGGYQASVMLDTIYDPESLTDKAGKKYKQPNNSTMTRLPVYDSGELPPPCEENHGCTVIENNGPLQSDWLCVCLKRNGEYMWVRHIDVSHGHAGQNDSVQPPDNEVDSEKNVNNQTIWDYTFPTSAGEMAKRTEYGDNPRPNPFGSQANWIGPAPSTGT